jgi:biopolymer transport protein ExbD
VKFGWARQRRDSITVDITPMIDVVFLLIIFFMTTAQYALLTRTELNLPKEKGESISASWRRSCGWRSSASPTVRRSS